MIGIYSWTNKINNKKYIGQSTNISVRKNEHIRENMYPENDTIIARAFKKYGTSNFEFEIIEECQVEQLNARELHWMNHYNTLDNRYGYNELLPNEMPSSIGQNNPRTELTDNDVLEIRNRIHILNESKLSVFQDFKNKVKESSFEKIYQGQTWTHLDTSMIKKIKTQRKGLPKAKLTKEDVIEIRTRNKNGETWQEIFQDYDHRVSGITIKRVVNYETWKNV